MFGFPGPLPAAPYGGHPAAPYGGHPGLMHLGLPNLAGGRQGSVHPVLVALGGIHPSAYPAAAHAQAVAAAQAQAVAAARGGGHGVQRMPNLPNATFKCIDSRGRAIYTKNSNGLAFYIDAQGVQRYVEGNWKCCNCMMGVHCTTVQCPFNHPGQDRKLWGRHCVHGKKCNKPSCQASNTNPHPPP